jgi:hypothetical protein
MENFGGNEQLCFNDNIDHTEILFMRMLFCIFNIVAIISGKLYIVTIFCDCQRGFGLDIGFIDHFNI